MANPNPSPSTRFKPGQVGNPNGGRRGPILSPLIRAALLQTEMRGKDGKVVQLPKGMTVGHLLVEMAIKHTINGNPAFFKELISRTDGVQPSQIDITSGGHPAALTLSALNLDELDTYESITRKLLAGRSSNGPGDDRGGEMSPESG